MPAALNLDLLRPIVDNALDLVDHKGFLKRREPQKYQKRAPSTADVAAVITNAVLKHWDQEKDRVKWNPVVSEVKAAGIDMGKSAIKSRWIPAAGRAALIKRKWQEAQAAAKAAASR